MPFQPSIKLGVAVHNRFQIKELNVFQLVGLFPNRWLDAGIKFSTFGFSDYRYSLFSTTLAKKINHRFSIGSGLYVGHETGDDYVKAMVHLKADIGVYFRASEWINLALLLRNVATNNRLDQFLFNLGIEWHPITSFGLVMEAISNWGDFYAMSFGLEYEIMDQLFVRAGVRTNPNMPAMGVSYSFEKITVDVSYFSHSILGNSTSIGISFHF